MCRNINFVHRELIIGPLVCVCVSVCVCLRACMCACVCVGVLVVSWYPPGLADDNGEPSDDLVPAVLDAAYRHNLKVVLLHPYLLLSSC